MIRLIFLKQLFVSLSTLFHNFIIKIIPPKKRCERCQSTNLDKGYYNRGWNELCRQACGDTGHYCMNCGKVNFDRPIEEYKKVLPVWCKAHD